MTPRCLYLLQFGGGDVMDLSEVDSAPQISLLYQTTRSHNLRLSPSHHVLYGILLLQLISSFLQAEVEGSGLWNL